ncbi:uncharacterized protein E0L32_000583 [Thyridium curvatum]|uniref:Molybdenum cofactor sulfurase n=1 Tax=Thyridium curvatum TaxID=1093900 RepID=A0A507B9W8_9PEZI|nr:uncharacterized protein E0L32_000583 [Thyridium curvatum]TPX14189.1 hypothetical protein E0L32_000583 [Thyridium curvatum]
MAGAQATGYNTSVEAFREHEYPMLKDAVYLDHAGTTVPPKSAVDAFAKDMTSNLFGNPHSGSPSSQLSSSRIDDIRARVLQFFNADPTEFDLVFVANATAGIKLVAEAFRARPGSFAYAYHSASHTSLVGVREEANRSLCLDNEAMEDWLFEKHRPLLLSDNEEDALLFAYPAQSNMDGRRYPLEWSDRLRRIESNNGRRLYTLLDAAAFASTSPLDLSDSDAAPDFTVLSFYKIFGFPDLGGLIIRRQAEPLFDSRKYFGGGTVDMVLCGKEEWHTFKTESLHSRLEDGTLPVHNIVALDTAMDAQRRLYGSMHDVASHTRYLSRRLFSGLQRIQHGNETPVCEMYSPDPVCLGTSIDCGPIVAFNLRNHLGAWISAAEFEKLASLKGFHIRTGGVCNPGGIASALGLAPWEMKRNFSAGFRCGTDNDVAGGKPTGVIRASLGAMSTLSDVDRFIAFIEEFYTERKTAAPQEKYNTRISTPASRYRVQRLNVFPIKGCGGFTVPLNTSWEIRPEGLAWDREWCLLHRGTGQALGQKRHPKMALLRPSLDFERGELRVRYAGDMPAHSSKEIAVPLSANPAMLSPVGTFRARSSRVCGDEISAQTYTDPTVNNFFSAALGVPCVLARFPPGGEGKTMRHSKARIQQHQNLAACARPYSLPGAFPTPPSPPDSDTESAQRRILLSNESPILAINLASVRALNKEIKANGGGKEVSADVFRANVVIDSTDGGGPDEPYAEDGWAGITVGGAQRFAMLGSCRRCHMICINQATAEKSEEPFVTLSKTRRFDGKVFFGTHMGLRSPNGLGEAAAGAARTKEAQHPTIRVGDAVVVEML